MLFGILIGIGCGWGIVVLAFICMYAWQTFYKFKGDQ